MRPFVVAAGVFHRVGKEVGVNLGHQSLVHRQGQVFVGHHPGPGVDLDVALLEFGQIKSCNCGWMISLDPAGPPPQDEVALLEMGLPEQGLDEEADPFIMLVQILVISLHLLDEVAEILLGIRQPAFRLSDLADALQFLQGLDLVPQMSQVEG